MPQITVGSGGVNRKAKQLTVSVGGVNRKVREAWAGVSGVNRKVFAAGKEIGTLPVGSVVKLTVNNATKEFLVVHQGLPSSMYDSSCSGAWLLIKDCCDARQWHSSNENDYANSTIHSYLNGSFYNSIAEKAIIRQVKIPYRPGSGRGDSVNSGANGLLCKVFLLSGCEVGLLAGESFRPADGSKLSYFLSGEDDAANKVRIARKYDNTGGAFWWLRSPHLYSGAYVGNITNYGHYDQTGTCTATREIRPAIVVPSTQTLSETPDSSGAYTIV